MKTLLLLSLMVIVTTFKPIKYKSTKFTVIHDDIILSLDSDTCTFVSKHDLKWENFKKLDSDRKDKWHKEKPFGPYNKEYYHNSGYDLGHLTPAHITSYNDSVQYHSFSMFNQAPQLAEFNRGKWKKLESSVEDSVMKYKSNVTIITGVIYDNRNKTYLNKSKIKIPIYFYKILSIQKKNKIYVWVGSNVNGNVINSDIKTLNGLLKINGDNLLYETTN